MAQPVVTKIERLDDLCGQAAQGVVHAFERGFHRHFPMVTFRQDIRQPDHGRPPPTDAPLLPMAGDMPVQDFWEAHLDHLPNEQRHIVDPLRDNHHIALAKDLLGLFRELHSHGILLSHAAAPEKSIATACHGLKGPSIQSSRPLEIQLLDFLYGEWGVISYKIMSIISASCDFTIKSGGIWISQAKHIMGQCMCNQRYFSD